MITYRDYDSDQDAIADVVTTTPAVRIGVVATTRDRTDKNVLILRLRLVDGRPATILLSPAGWLPMESVDVLATEIKDPGTEGLPQVEATDESLIGCEYTGLVNDPTLRELQLSENDRHLIALAVAEHFVGTFAGDSH